LRINSLIFSLQLPHDPSLVFGNLFKGYPSVGLFNLKVQSHFKISSNFDPWLNNSLVTSSIQRQLKSPNSYSINLLEDIGNIYLSFLINPLF
jgi:hypothetical protein